MSSTVPASRTKVPYVSAMGSTYESGLSTSQRAKIRSIELQLLARPAYQVRRLSACLPVVNPKDRVKCRHAEICHVSTVTD